MRRYLLVLDTDLLALDEKLDLEPINYLVERQEQQPCEVVVLSLADTGQTQAVGAGAAAGRCHQPRHLRPGEVPDRAQA